MKYTADSWFFIELINQNTRALNIWMEINEGKSRLIVPSIVIAEIVRKFLKNNLNRELQTLLNGFNNTEKIRIVDLTKEIAEHSGKLSYTYNMPMVDAIILTTAILTEYNNIITDDPHFKPAEKQNRIKRVRW
ncbi:MAG: PIN domain-containing protein [Candidatus Aenigmatarchaeota archaeon]